MQFIKEQLGKVVTIKSVTGDEYVGLLAGLDDDNTIITVNNPKQVIINQDSVVLIPYLLTAPAKVVIFNLSNIMSVNETLESTAEDYRDLVKTEEEVLQEQPLSEEEGFLDE